MNITKQNYYTDSILKSHTEKKTHGVKILDLLLTNSAMNNIELVKKFAIEHKLNV